MKAILLCAGYGTRLGDLTKEIPKPMLHVCGKPLLLYTLVHLRSQGIEEFAINLHFQPEAIRDFFGNGSQWNVRIAYAYEEVLLGTAGTVKSLAGWIGDSESVLVVYGDILTDQPLGPLVEKHRQERSLATLILHQRGGSNSVVELADEGRIDRFLERPTKEEMPACTRKTWVNSGIQMLSREFVDAIPSGYPIDLPRDVYAAMVGTRRLFGVPLSGYRYAIDSAARYEQASEAVRNGWLKIAF